MERDVPRLESPVLGETPWKREARRNARPNFLSRSFAPGKRDCPFGTRMFLPRVRDVRNFLSDRYRSCLEIVFARRSDPSKNVTRVELGHLSRSSGRDAPVG